MRIVLFALCLCLVALSARAADSSGPPVAERKPVIDTYHGQQIVDPYRWLENAGDPAVQKWMADQNRYARDYLAHLPSLPEIRARVKELMSATSPDYSSLQYQAGVLFAMKTQPPKEQPFLITLRSPNDPSSAHVVLDPTQIDPSGKTTIDFYEPSPDAKLVAVSLSKGGSEDGTLHLFEVATGKDIGEDIPRVQFATAGGSVAWLGDGSGFFYTRYPAPGERPKDDLNFYQQVYFHKLHTPTSQDTYAVGKDFPRIGETILIASPDGRSILAMVQNGDSGEFAHYLRLPSGDWRQLTRFEDKITGATFGPDDALYLLSLKDSPRGKILRLALADPQLSAAQMVVPPSDVAIQGVRFTANAYATAFVTTAHRLYIVDSAGGPEQIRSVDLKGGNISTVPVPPISSVEQILPLHDDVILFRSQSYITPPAWYRYDPATNQVTRTALFRTSPVDFSDVDVVRDFATSRDGTRVPMTILMPRGTHRNGQNPTLLYGYGGFGISQTPAFNTANHVWLEQGCVYAIANLRGGSEYGEEWHLNGNRIHKQHVFDDFIACAQRLIEQKYTQPQKLAIRGGSNGGLLMGAVVTQHPELFHAVVSHVGYYDMLRFEQSPNGAFNATEYGTVKNPAEFEALRAYSPYHHVQDGTAYPSMLLTTGVNDGRVDPAHSRKMTARLQAANSSSHPILLRVNYGAGHGIGSSLSDRIDETADVFAFLFHALGVHYHPIPPDTHHASTP